MFVHYNGKLVNSDTIESIDYGALALLGSVLVHYKNKINEPVEGIEAFNLVMDLCPKALEGEGLEYQRHAWAVHNLLGHPLMQLFTWLGYRELGLKIHDETVPHPITK
jgi:hypothetical protein